MASYQEQYVYSVRVNGAARAVRQLQELQQLSQQALASMTALGAGISTTGATSSGATAGTAFGSSFTSMARRAMTNVAVYGAIGVGIGAITQGVRAWADANVALSNSLAELEVKLGVTRQEAEAYYSVMQQAAFATGQDVQEAVYSKTVEERVNRPGLAAGGMEFGLVFPDVPVQDAVNNLLALQIQFGASFGEINEVLLDTVQASGLTAKELLNLSDTWGPLSQELGMVDASGQRTSEGMRNISGLMAGMATVMGESGSTIENFLRKMSNFYTNPDIKAFLATRGIETTAGKTAEGLDIRVPFMELMNLISQQAKVEPGFAVGLQEFFPNQLGQPTQQQLQELIRNWGTISGIMSTASDATAEWGNAVQISSERASVAMERLGVAFSGFFAAIGGNEALVNLLNQVAASVQNTTIRTAGTSSGQDKFSAGSAALDLGLLQWQQGMDERMRTAVRMGGGEASIPLTMYGQDTGIDASLKSYFSEIFTTAQLPEQWTPEQTMRFYDERIPEFLSSEAFDPSQGLAEITQAFIVWMEGLNEVIAAQVSPGEAYTKYQASVYGSPVPVEGLSRTAESLDVVGSAAWLASRSITAMAEAADKEYSIMTSKSVQLPEGITLAEGMKEYTRRMREISAFASENDVKAGVEITPTTIWGPDGSPFTVLNVEASVLSDAFRFLAQDASLAADALSVLGGVRIELPEGVTQAAVDAEYNRLLGANTEYATQTGTPLGLRKSDAILTENGVPVVTFSDVDKNLLGQAVSNVGDVVTEQQRTRSENRALANQANAAAEARAKRLESIFNGMFDAITKPTSVTALDLMYNTPGGTYTDKWDEPVRQMRADVNNLIGGKPNEYNFGGGVFGGIFDPSVVEFARGADQATKDAIMKDLQRQAEEAFYSFTLPPDAYAGGKDALVASAQEWVAGKKNEKANKSMMKGWLVDAGLGPEAMGFLDEMDEPPIVKMLTGGKTKDEMTAIFSDKIPNVSDSVASGAKDVQWIAIIASAITKQSKDNSELLIGSGQVMGGWMAQGAASAFVATITPQIIAAVLAAIGGP